VKGVAERVTRGVGVFVGGKVNVGIRVGVVDGVSVGVRVSVGPGVGVMVGEGVGVQVAIGEVGTGVQVGNVKPPDADGGKGLTASTPNPTNA
jgi:predicted thioesterase